MVHFGFQTLQPENAQEFLNFETFSSTGLTYIMTSVKSEELCKLRLKLTKKRREKGGF